MNGLSLEFIIHPEETLKEILENKIVKKRIMLTYLPKKILLKPCYKKYNMVKWEHAELNKT